MFQKRAFAGLLSSGIASGISCILARKPLAPRASTLSSLASPASKGSEISRLPRKLFPFHCLRS